MSTATHDAALAQPPLVHAAQLSLVRRIARRLRWFARRSPMSAFWGVIAAAIVVMAISAPAIAPYDPLKSDFRAMSKPPSERHYFGSDQIGRDTLSRVIHGSRASLTVAIGAVVLGTTLGAIWGLACGYFGGRFDIISQRAIEFMQSFPDLILAMATMTVPRPAPSAIAMAIAKMRSGNDCRNSMMRWLMMSKRPPK